ncbi:MAG TPA: threonine aldolase family protein [Pseudolabrys sp.]|jgi:threonine aldolase|nr:threonine aldolase family protein [Pseudolabrys sp.]
MIDLRSDTVTLPTDEMRQAMRDAEVGDDSRDGDPTVRRLEAMAARMTGKEAGLLVASGTMANLVALLTHAQRGGEVLLDARGHIMRSELGGVARLAGLFPKVYPATAGVPDVAGLRELIQPKTTKTRIATSLIAIETSHNDAGGTVPPLACLAELQDAAASTGIPIHIDGARLFNAAAALGVPASDIARYGDSVGFCLSKGLSAPVGSVLCGRATFIEEARAYRRMVGGAMRQAGIVAAAGIVALERMVDRLADDHRHAQQIARGLGAIDPTLVDVKRVETNIVMVDLSRTNSTADAWNERLAANGVRAGAWTRTSLRLVTHRHIDAAAAEQAIAAFRSVYEGQGSPRRVP